MRHSLPARWIWLGLFTLILSLPMLAQERSEAEAEHAQGEGNRIIERERWFYGQREFPLGHIPPGAHAKALARRKQMEAEEFTLRQSGAAYSLKQFSGTSWSLIGPQATSSPFYKPYVSGRVSALAVDPTDPNTVYLGGAEGGVWKTTNGGANWTPLTDGQASLATGSIAIDPQNHTTIYVGTGEENFGGDNYYGAGVLKSTDGGASWSHLPGPFVGPTNSNPPSGGAYIGSIAVQPGNSQVLLAGVLIYSTQGTNFGQNIMRSTDGGVSWSTVLPGGNNGGFGGNSTAVLFDPTVGSGIAYAAFGSLGVYRSPDGGLTWKALPGTGANLFPTSSVGRIALAIAPSAPGTLFASVANVSTLGLLGVYKTTDSGQNWIKQVNAPDYCTPQCWYDNVIAVHPTNPAVVYAGGAFGGGTKILYRSTDGGTNWSNVTAGTNNVSVHADFHALAFSANGGVLYAGNDGGVWSTTDTATSPLNWANLNTTLALTQFYPGMGLHPTNPNIMFGGTQDNGTQQYSGNATWTDVGYCGDGSAAAIDFVNTNNIYINCNSIDIAKSTTGGTQFSFKVVGGADPFGNGAFNGINTSDRVKFIPPLVMDPNNSQTLYFGTFQLYQTTNGAALGNANSWVSISPDLTSGGTITAIAVAPSDSNVIFVGTDDGNVQVTSNALSGAATWSLINSGLNSVTSVAVEPANAATVYVGLSGFGVGHVLRSTNSGGTWADISGNLPDTPVDAIVVDPNIPNTLYIGTDVGAFTTSNDNAVSPTWTTLGSGLPNVAVLALGLQNSTRTLVAGTHGRSAWTLALPGGFTLGTPSASSVNVAATGTSTPSITFQVTALGALAGPVNLTCPSGLPSGAVCNFSPSASVTPTVGSPSPITLTVTTAGSPVGASVVTIAANSTGQPQQTQTFTLHVLPDYTYTVSNLVLYTRAGTTGSFNGTLTTGNGYSNSVSITCAGNPAPLPATCTPPVATTPTAGGATANVTAGNASTGDFNIHLNAVGSDPLPVSTFQPVTLHVVNASFTVNPTTPISVAAGSSSGPIALQISASGSFVGSVTLSCPGLPAGATCAFSPSATVSPTSSSAANVTMTVNSGTAAPGNYPGLTVSGAVANPTFTITSTAYTVGITNTGITADLQARVAPAAGQPAILPVGTKASFKVTATNATSAPGPVNVTLIFSVSAPNLLAAQNGCSVVGASLSCAIPNLTFGAPVTLNFTTAALPFNVRNLTATATVSVANPESPPGDNTQTTPAKPVGPRPISRRNLTTLPK